MTPYVIILLCLPFWQWRLFGKNRGIFVSKLFKHYLQIGVSLDVVSYIK